MWLIDANFSVLFPFELLSLSYCSVEVIAADVSTDSISHSSSGDNLPMLYIEMTLIVGGLIVPNLSKFVKHAF